MSAETLKVLMVEDHEGSPDGTSLVEYFQGREYTFRTAGEVDLGRVFLREGWGVEIVEEVPADVEIVDVAGAVDATGEIVEDVEVLEAVEVVAVDEPETEPNEPTINEAAAVDDVPNEEEDEDNADADADADADAEPPPPPEPLTKQMPKPRTRTRSRKRKQ